MIIKNVIVYTEDKKFTAGGIVVHDDKIESIYTTENVPDMLGEEVIDGQGAYAIPGLIDLHFHGCMGDDFCDNSKEAIENIAKYEAVKKNDCCYQAQYPHRSGLQPVQERPAAYSRLIR